MRCKLCFILLILLLFFIYCQPDLTPEKYYGQWRKVQVQTEIPSERYNLTLTNINDNNLVLFGGSSPKNNDTWTFDLSNNTWTEHIIPEPIPSVRSVYGMSYAGEIDGKERVILFGGLPSYDNYPPMYDDTWIYTPDDKTWIEYNTGGVKPPNRMRHRIVYIGDNKSIMFGGYYETSYTDYHTLNDLWEYDLDNHQWTEIIINVDKPKATQDHAMAYSPDTNEIVIFGGLLGEEPPITFTKETWILNLDSMRWRKVKYDDDDIVPIPQIDTQFAYLGNDAFMMFTPNDENASTVPMTWIFNLKYEKWYQCEITGEQLPLPRDSYGMTSIGDKAYMFGGAWDFEYFNDLWEFQITQVDQPGEE